MIEIYLWHYWLGYNLYSLIDLEFKLDLVLAPDAIIKSSMIATLHISLTNDIYYFVVLLELETKLNALLLSPVEESTVMIILLPLLDDDTTDINS